jgi:hypothetical protein
MRLRHARHLLVVDVGWGWALATSCGGLRWCTTWVRPLSVEDTHGEEHRSRDAAHAACPPSVASKGAFGKSRLRYPVGERSYSAAHARSVERRILRVLTSADVPRHP